MSTKLFLLAAIVCVGLASTAAAEEEREPSPRMDLGDLAREIMGRSGSASQVLSLNLTNLVILLVLKGLLFGVTMYGNGGHGKGRALDSEDLISESEIMLITSYLMGDADKDFSCLNRVACQDPRKSKKYLQAAKVLLKGSKMFSEVVGYDEKYEKLVVDMQEAIEFGAKYGTCEQKYSCKAQNNL